MWFWGSRTFGLSGLRVWWFSGFRVSTSHNKTRLNDNAKSQDHVAQNAVAVDVLAVPHDSLKEVLNPTRALF